jgi:hypothetical protein
LGTVVERYATAHFLKEDNVVYNNYMSSMPVGPACQDYLALSIGPQTGTENVNWDIARVVSVPRVGISAIDLAKLSQTIFKDEALDYGT